MAKKSNTMRWIIGVGVICLLGYLTYSTMQQTKQQYEVCVNFKGGSHCSTASGANYEQAVRSAQEIDCQLLTNGRDENMVCIASPAASVRQIK
jgi:hypothetical protein